jgi:hypothetical protein
MKQDPPLKNDKSHIDLLEHLTGGVSVVDEDPSRVNHIQDRMGSSQPAHTKHAPKSSGSK